MKKQMLTCALACLLTGFGTASAQVVSPYTVDFNTAIDVSNHEFKVDKGWGHIVGSSSGNYVNYQYKETDGVDGTGCLFVPTQSVGGYWSTTDVYDLLVPPKLTGSASIMVKLSAPAGEIAFYEVTRNADGTYTKGSKISATVPQLDQYDFTEVTLPTTSNGYVGIYAKFAYLDDFKADQAEIILVKSMALKNLERLNKDEVFCDADGFFTLHYSVQVENTGEVDFHAGDENFSVSIINDSKQAVVYTLPIAQDLAVGATSETLDLEARISYADYPDNDHYMVREDMTNTTLHGNWLTVKPYAPILNLCTTESDVAIGTTDVQNWGTIQQPTTKHYRIRNVGPAPLTVSGIDLPEGFTATPTVPITVEGNAEVAFDVTLLTESFGTKEGNMMLFTNAGNLMVPVKGVVMDPTVWYVDFEDNQLPGNMIAGDNWAVKMHSSYLGLTENTYRAESSNNTLSKLISPKLKVEADDEMTFLAGKKDDNSVLNIYYSADRKNWQLAKAISSRATSEDNLFNDEKVSDGNYWNATYYYLPKTFSLNNIPAGEWYIAFESGTAWVDNLYGFKFVEVDHDLMLDAQNIPEKGTVNSEMTATASVKNLNAKPEAAESYTAKLYLGEEVVAEAEAVEMQATAITDFSFTFTPHEAGTFQAHIEFVGEGFSVKTDNVTVTIDEESAGGEVQIGEVKQTNYQASPLNSYYNNSGSEILYTAEMLEAKGIVKGSKIQSITFKGYNTSKEMHTKVSAWIENTEDSSFGTTFTAHATESMTQILSAEEHDWPIIGSVNDHQPMLTLTFNEPFVYDGNSIRLTVQSEKSDNATGQQMWGYLNFEQDNTITGFCYTRANDNSLAAGTWTAQAFPVTYFDVIAEPATLSGMVTNEQNEPVEGASVKLACGNVEYSTTSADDGSYTINVVQTDKDYTLTATAEGYEDYTSESVVSFADGNATQDIVLSAVKTMVEISGYGWATFSADKAIDFAQTEGLTAYIVTSHSEKSVHLEEVTAVPAHTGVLLQGEEGSYELHPADEATSPAVNLLQATDEEMLTVGGDNYGLVYAFGVMDEKVGFMKASEGYTVGMNKAYLLLDEALAAPFFGIGDEVATNIEKETLGISNHEGTGMYDLQGRRVSNPTKGVYIINGKKTIIK